METEEKLNDKADELDKIYKSIQDLGVKLGKEKSETHMIIQQSEEDVKKEMEKLQKMLGKIDNSTNNKLGQMQKLMQESTKKLTDSVDVKIKKNLTEIQLSQIKLHTLEEDFKIL